MKIAKQKKFDFKEDLQNLLMMKQMTQTTHLKVVEVVQELKTLQLYLDLENP
jgi:hypothetical protein